MSDEKAEQTAGKNTAYRNPGRPAVKKDVPSGDEQLAPKIAKAAAAKAAKGKDK